MISGDSFHVACVCVLTEWARDDLVAPARLEPLGFWWPKWEPTREAPRNKEALHGVRTSAVFLDDHLRMRCEHCPRSDERSRQEQAFATRDARTLWRHHQAELPFGSCRSRRHPHRPYSLDK